MSAVDHGMIRGVFCNPSYWQVRIWGDGLGSGDFVSCYSYHMSVRKFQSQRLSDVETPVPSIWAQKC
jgi:hypothetical protein